MSARGRLKLGVILGTVLLGVAGGAGLWHLSQTAAARGGEETDELAGQMDESAGRAVEMAQSYGITLDYSPASIDRMDSLLGKIRDDWLTEKSELELNVAAEMCGAYIGEVILREHPQAHWERNHPSRGPNSYPLYLGAGDSCLFPVAWCRMRIQNGALDTVAPKFRSAQAEFRK